MMLVERLLTKGRVLGLEQLSQRSQHVQHNSTEICSICHVRCGSRPHQYELFWVKTVFSSLQASHQELHDQRQIAASLQEAIVDILLQRLGRAASMHPNLPMVLAGGVAANARLRERMQVDFADRTCLIPAPKFCTDNGAMVAYLGGNLWQQGSCTQPIESLTRAHWPLGACQSSRSRLLAAELSDVAMMAYQAGWQSSESIGSVGSWALYSHKIVGESVTPILAQMPPGSPSSSLLAVQMMCPERLWWVQGQ